MAQCITEFFDRTRGSGYKLKCRRLYLNIRKLNVRVNEHRLPRQVVGLYPWRYQKLSGCGFGVDVRWPRFNSEIGQDDL